VNEEAAMTTDRGGVSRHLRAAAGPLPQAAGGTPVYTPPGCASRRCRLGSSSHREHPRVVQASDYRSGNLPGGTEPLDARGVFLNRGTLWQSNGPRRTGATAGGRRAP